MHKRLIAVAALTGGCTFNVYQPSVNTSVDAQAQIAASNSIVGVPAQADTSPSPAVVPSPAAATIAQENPSPIPAIAETTLTEYRDDYFSFTFPKSVVAVRSANGRGGFQALDNTATYEIALEILTGSWLSQYDRLKNGAPGRIIKSGEIKLDGQAGYFVESVTIVNNKDRIYVDLSGTCLGRIIHVGILAEEDLSGELTGDALVSKIAPTWRWNLGAPQLSH